MNQPQTIPCYSIKDWNLHFENGESRRYKTLTWVPMKNKHDGKSYRRVTHLNNAAEIFAAWCLIVQVASKMPKRGTLSDDDGPLTALDLADKTGFPAAMFQSALTVLSQPNIGWLIFELREAAGSCGDARQNPVHNITEHNITEHEREEGARAPESVEDGGHFPEAERPSWDEFWTYCQSPHCGLPAEWFAKDKFLAAEAAKWKGNDDWRAYARRVKGWWESDGRQMQPKGQRPTASKPASDGPKLTEVQAYAQEKWGDEDSWANWAVSFHREWAKRGWKRQGRVIDWKVELSEQVSKWRKAQ